MHRKSLRQFTWLAWAAVLGSVIIRGWQIHQSDARWRASADSIDHTIESLKSQPPPSIDDRAWIAAVDRLMAVRWNVCYHETWISTQAMAKLASDIKALVDSSKPSAGLLRQVFERIGVSNSRTAMEIKIHEDDFEDFLARCE